MNKLCDYQYIKRMVYHIDEPTLWLIHLLLKIVMDHLLGLCKSHLLLLLLQVELKQKNKLLGNLHNG